MTGSTDMVTAGLAFLEYQYPCIRTIDPGHHANGAIHPKSAIPPSRVPSLASAARSSAPLNAPSAAPIELVQVCPSRESCPRKRRLPAEQPPLRFRKVGECPPQAYTMAVCAVSASASRVRSAARAIGAPSPPKAISGACAPQVTDRRSQTWAAGGTLRTAPLLRGRANA